MPLTLASGKYRELTPTELKLVTDKRAQKSVMINKITSILTSDQKATSSEKRFRIGKSRR